MTQDQRRRFVDAYEYLCRDSSIDMDIVYIPPYVRTRVTPFVLIQAKEIFLDGPYYEFSEDYPSSFEALSRIGQGNSWATDTWTTAVVENAHRNYRPVFVIIALFHQKFLDSVPELPQWQEWIDTSQEYLPVRTYGFAGSARHIFALDALLPFSRIAFLYARMYDAIVETRRKFFWFPESKAYNEVIFGDATGDREGFGLNLIRRLIFFSNEYLLLAGEYQWFMPTEWLQWKARNISALPARNRQSMDYFSFNRLMLLQRMRFASEFLPGVVDQQKVFEFLKRYDQHLAVL